MAEKTVKINASFNLLKPTRKPLAPIEKVYTWALTIGRYLIIGVELVVLTAFAARFKLDYDISDLTDSIEDKAILVSGYGAKEDRYRELIAKTEFYENAQKYQTTISDDIQHIETLASTHVTITAWTYGSNQLSLSGVADTLDKLAQFEASLEKETQEYHVQHPLETVPVRYASMTVNKTQTGSQIDDNVFTMKLDLLEDGEE